MISGMIRLLIVDDHPAVAKGLAAVLAAEPGMSVAAVFDAESARIHFGWDEPDVVLCDVMLQNRDSGFDLLRQFGDRTRFLMYSAYDLPAHYRRSVAWGSWGYLSKLEEVETISRAVRAVAAGRHWFSPAVLAWAREAPPSPTARECELLAMLVLGSSNHEISGAMGIRLKTVEGTIRRLFDRYAVNNRTQLAHLAITQGWVTSNPARLK
jgi:DNA-binding NarL/FixJ family response regulator